MKRCPTCQKEFADSMRFCQTDGTPLLDVVESPVPEDPFRTMIAPPTKNTSANVVDDSMKTMLVNSSSKEEDLLQIPEVFDPMKTMVVSDEIKKSVPPPTPPTNEPIVTAPEPPKFNEPSLSPPSFGDLSSTPISNPPKPVESPKFDAPSSPFSQPPKFDAPKSPFNEPPKVSPPSSPLNQPPKFNATPLPSQGSANDSPFGTPLNQPVSSPFDKPSPPPFMEPPVSNTPSPFETPSFNPPPIPAFGQQQSNDPFSAPVQNNDWNPPPAPVASWGDQGVGSNTPFTPPPVGAGGSLNQTLPIISLVLGIISICCPIGPLTGIAALVTGFLGMKNANNDPNQYGGKGLAIAGMITGGLFFLLSIIWWILQIVGNGLALMTR
jgi:hypothetical protein